MNAIRTSIETFQAEERSGRRKPGNEILGRPQARREIACGKLAGIAADKCGIIPAGEQFPKVLIARVGRTPCSSTWVRDDGVLRQRERVADIVRWQEQTTPCIRPRLE